MTSSVSPPVDIAPAGPKRRQRGIQLPQLLLSLLVVSVFALLAVWWQANTTSRQPVLALAADVRIGQAITAADLTEIYISTDVPASVESPESRQFFIGARAVSDLEAGTIITGPMFRRTPDLLPGQATVGLVLDGTRAPSGLVVEDRVQVLIRDQDKANILAPDAQVDSVRTDGNQTVIRLRLGVEAAQLVQINAANVVLIEVDKSGPAEWETEEVEDPS